MLHTLSSIYMCMLLLTEKRMHAAHTVYAHADVDDEITPEPQPEAEAEQLQQPLPLRYYLLRPRAPQRTLLGGQQLLLYVRKQTADDSLAIEVPADGTVAHILHRIYGDESDGANVLFGGQLLDADLLLSESGLSAEATVEVTPPPTDCMRLTFAFDNTNVFNKVGWQHIRTSFEPQTCCDTEKGVTCDDPEAERLKITEIWLPNKGLWGSIEWSQLPRSLEVLGLGGNQFDGEVAWHNLPRSLKTLNLARTPFRGEVAWQDLPQSLQNLWLPSTQFHGDVAWQHLQALTWLQLLCLDDTRFDVSDEAKATAIRELKASNEQLQIYW